ncbi:MAG TPA: cation diffusion facilitator family transporter [Thermoanaerobaculia bacterium]
MGAGHSHPHHHHGRSNGNRRRLAITLGLAVVYMLAELVGGLLTGSLALLADAGHMLSDSAALALSLFALWIAQRPADPRRTWGYHRIEILAALANGATLAAISVFILLEAWERFRQPSEVDAPLMMAIAAGGLAVNLIALRILSAGRSESLNMRGAWLHVLTDALGSVQAIAAGALIWALGWQWADPAASVLIALLVLYSSWGLLKETVGVLMEGAPRHIDVDEVRNALIGIPGVTEVHDLHVWTITSGMESLSVHVVVEDEAGYCDMLVRVRSALHDRFGIDHLTIQIEAGEMGGCGLHA